MKKKTLISTLICLMLLSTISTLSAETSIKKEPSFFDLNSLKIDLPLRDIGGYNQNEFTNGFTISSITPPFDPYPQNDELTESAHRQTYGLKEYLLVSYPFAQYWCEMSNPGNSIFAIKDAQDGIGNATIFDVAYVNHHYLLFYFTDEMNLASCHYIKYWQRLSVAHTGNCWFGFFSFEGAEEYFAAINYTVNPNGLRYRQEFNVLQASDWFVEPGFDWNRVSGFLIASEITQVGSVMSIDAPKLYFNFPEPLPVNEVIDENEGIGEVFDAAYTDPRIRMKVQLWHGNISLEREHWLLKIYAEDMFYLENPGASVHPSFCKINVILPEVAEEDPPFHIPQAGYVGSSRFSTGLSYYGIGFSVASPEKYISYSRYYENGVLKIEWNVEPSKVIGSVSGFLFFDYCEFAVGFTTPIGYKSWAYVSGEVKMYMRSMPLDWWPFCSYLWREEIDWLYVDPPGSEPVEPETPNPIPSTPQDLYLVCVNTLQTCHWNGAPKTEFQRGDMVWVDVNYTWGRPLSTQKCIDLRIYDSEGNMISLMMMKGWIWREGYYLLQGHKCFGTSMFIPQFAKLGQAKIVIRILNDWPWIDDREYARLELNITIKR